ncbi:segregation/condensation protein A [Halobacillus trueperi]|uniref:Segregation and condensation protein A n=2 Tax=Halobacillus TaxID=45667 RepID=A0A1H0SUT7_HALAD|nr:MULTISPECIES: segregation/condensation protein A [Halobacillus]RDY70141.1 segregation/condensation protein A [Halobacillus trueperi]SDP45471.1 condensin subunit ScpA [Halobacillus aidingensis]
MKKSYQVKVEGFEGPLDLLLHLINRYEIDIYNIPVSQITDQYMNYIHTMQELELDLASEYLVMAATLLAMKSQMLLPNQNMEDEFEDGELEDDPREDLMRRLIEYRKYKQAAEELKEKELDANRIYTRPPLNMEGWEEEMPEVRPGEASVYDMIQAMGNLLKRAKTEKPQEAKVRRDEIPIQMRMEEILGKIDVQAGGTPFHQLFEKRTRPHIVVTFIALLELMKSNDIVCVQQQHFDELIVYKTEDAPWS